MAVFSGNGSNTAPSFTFSSDNDTGMYRVDANELGLTAGGTARLRIFDEYTTITGGSVVPFLVEAASGAGEAEVTRLSRANGADTHYLSTLVDADANLVKFQSTGSSAGGITLESNTAVALETLGTGEVGVGVTPSTAWKFRTVGETRIDGASMKGSTQQVGAAPGLITITVTHSSGVTMFIFGVSNSGWNASTALMLLHGGITSTINQSTLATIYNSSPIPATSITKTGSGFTFQLNLTAGLGSQLYWQAFGSGAEDATVTVS